MKRKLFITLALVAITLTATSQSINVFMGGATKKTVLIGMELRSDNFGFYVSRYYNKVDLPKRVNSQYTSRIPGYILYDGIMLGVNKHVECMSEINLFGGVGLLNEYYIYNEGQGKQSMTKNQKFAYELGAGKDFRVNHMNIGLKFGVNSCTSIFGALSVGYGF